MSEKRVTIGLSYYGSKILNYIDWLKSSSDQVEILKLHHSTNKPEDLLKCNSLVLPGGVDINPENYNQENKGLSKIDEESKIRDKFERELIDVALKNNMPILGICRGFQLVNVHLGGTLFQHIDNHRNSDNDEDLTHSVKVNRNSQLFEIVNLEEGLVNSSHHQAIDKVSDYLVASAFSEDGIVEALEWKDKSIKSPLLLVQWHPERMKDRNENPFSKEILNWFINCQINNGE
ncbi:MAG: gamma-glutamyl-gamma-aminobutyrate hydrolase family protein [Ignavibacteria bacterium]|nr:gamma-glutamyl-gamma-aminobutyrate hydrolase family protein [Ignavibacteria bacterium]